MVDIIPPTSYELFEEDGIISINRSVDDSWRHGVYVTEIYHRKSDNTYWKAFYRLSTDGETNELEEGTAKINQVKPITKTITDYIPI